MFNDKEDDKKDEENATLPKVTQGENLPITAKALLEKQTKPRPLYNEATLLKALETAGKEIDDEELRYAMKDSGLGTPATRAAIIETLLKRNYIIREKKNLVPTTTGIAVYEVVKNQQIAQAELTGTWEKRLEEIRSGASVTEFQNEIKTYTRAITSELLAQGKSLKIPAVEAAGSKATA
ncbi:DNA topoisomerase [Mucilaginibacter sp. UC70_90]